MCLIQEKRFLTRKGASEIIGNFRKGGLGPMDNFESKTQYVSGTADVKSYEKSLYHRS